MSQYHPTDKAEIRSLYRRMRLSLTPGERSRLSRFACGHVLRSTVWKKASVVALYVAIKGETDASGLLEDAWACGKTVLLPVCSADRKGEMRLCPCAGPDALRPGLYGIPEPVMPDPVRPEPALTSPTGLSQPPAVVPDLFIVPGVAFTAQGHRLGQGGGYYDRLLAAPEFAKATRMGLAYGFQLLPALPEDAWDLPMHAVATEKGIIWT